MQGYTVDTKIVGGHDGQNSNTLVETKKRKRVKVACAACQRAHATCDEGRPCSRCIKHGITDCHDSDNRKQKPNDMDSPALLQSNENASGSFSPSGQAGQRQYPVTFLSCVPTPAKRPKLQSPMVPKYAMDSPALELNKSRLEHSHTPESPKLSGMEDDDSDASFPAEEVLGANLGTLLRPAQVPRVCVALADRICSLQDLLYDANLDHHAASLDHIRQQLATGLELLDSVLATSHPPARASRDSSNPPTYNVPRLYDGQHNYSRQSWPIRSRITSLPHHSPYSHPLDSHVPSHLYNNACALLLVPAHIGNIPIRTSSKPRTYARYFPLSASYDIAYNIELPPIFPSGMTHGSSSSTFPYASEQSYGQPCSSPVPGHPFRWM